MSISRISPSASTSAPLPVYAPQPTAGLVNSGFTASDPTQAVTLTGRRFYFEYRWFSPPTSIGNQVATGIGWSGATISGLAAETEYSVNGAPYPRSTYSTTYSGSFPAAGGSPAMFTTGQSIGYGMLILRGVIDFTTTASITLTPYVQPAASTTIYMRSFRVDLIA